MRGATQFSREQRRQFPNFLASFASQSRQHPQSFLSKSNHFRTSPPEYLILACYTKGRKSFMSKSTAPGIPNAQQSIPFAAAAASIREAHRAKKALLVRLPISSMLRNLQKQRNLQRHKNLHTDTRICASQSLPTAQKLYTFAARSNIIPVYGSCNPSSNCLLSEVALHAAHRPKSRKRLSTSRTETRRAPRGARLKPLRHRRNRARLRRIPMGRLKCSCGGPRSLSRLVVSP